MQAHENEIVTFDQWPFKRNNACGRYNVNTFVVLTRLQRFLFKCRNFQEVNYAYHCRCVKNHLSSEEARKKSHASSGSGHTHLQLVDQMIELSSAASNGSKVACCVWSTMIGKANDNSLKNNHISETRWITTGRWIRYSPSGKQMQKRGSTGACGPVVHTGLSAIGK